MIDINMKKIEGKKIKDIVAQELKKEFDKLTRKVSLAVVVVGDDLVVENFVNIKKKFAETCGVDFNVFRFESSVKEDVLAEEIKKIQDKNDGIIVQLPLPKEISQDKILGAIDPSKDVDVLNKETYEKFKNKETQLLPPVVGAVRHVLNYTKYQYELAKIVIVGYGDLVGRPVSDWFSRDEVGHTVVDKDTEGSEDIIKGASLLIAGAGVPGLIKKDHVQKGVILIDAGTTEKGKTIMGDIDPECYEKSLYYTPVPGGVGPLTVVSLFENLLILVQSSGDGEVVK